MVLLSLLIVRAFRSDDLLEFETLAEEERPGFEMSTDDFATYRVDQAATLLRRMAQHQVAGTVYSTDPQHEVHHTITEEPELENNFDDITLHRWKKLRSHSRFQIDRLSRMVETDVDGDSLNTLIRRHQGTGSDDSTLNMNSLVDASCPSPATRTTSTGSGQASLPTSSRDPIVSHAALEQEVDGFELEDAAFEEEGTMSESSSSLSLARSDPGSRGSGVVRNPSVTEA